MSINSIKPQSCINKVLINILFLIVTNIVNAQVDILIRPLNNNFCYGDTIVIDSVSFIEQDTNDFKPTGATQDTIFIDVPNGFETYSVKDNVVSYNIGGGFNNIQDVSLGYNADSTLIYLIYQANSENNKERISIKDIVLKPILGQASYGNQFTIDGNGSFDFTGIDTTIGNFRMNNPNLVLSSVSTIDGCSNNPITLNFSINNIFQTNCLDSVIVAVQRRDPNPVIETLLDDELTNETFSVTTNRISNNDSLVIVNVYFTTGHSIFQTFSIGDSASSAKIMLKPSQEPEYNGTQLRTSAYLYSFYLGDTIQNYTSYNSINTSRQNSFYYSFKVLQDDAEVPGAIYEYPNPPNPSFYYKRHYLYPATIGAGFFDMVISREHPISGCIVNDTISLLVAPDVVDVSEVFCYGTDTQDTVSVSKNWVNSYEIDGVSSSTTTIDKLVVRYGSQTGLELTPDGSTSAYEKYPINPTEIYNSVTSGIANPPSEIFVQFELWANSKLYRYVPTTSCYWCTNHNTYHCYTYNVRELIADISMPIESATSRVVRAKDNGYLINFDTMYCQNQGAVELVGNYFTDSISKPAYIVGNDWLFNPLQDFANNDSSFYLTYYYRDDNNCPEDSTYFVSIFEMPDVEMSFNTICEGDTLNFSEDIPVRPDTNNVSVWNWSFGDGFILTNLLDSNTDIPTGTHGDRTFGTFKSPSHVYDKADTFKVALSVQTDLGCASRKDTLVTIGSYPIVNFDYAGKIAGSPVTFTNNTTNAGFDPITEFAWSFTDPSNNTSQYNTALIDPIEQTFIVGGVYNVGLSATTNNGCSETIFMKVPSFPVIPVDTLNFYNEAFSDAEEPYGWIPSQRYISELPAGWSYKPVSGEFNDGEKHADGNMWATGSPDLALNNEKGWLESPCFDLSDLTFPMISVDIYQSIEEGRDGAVLQYTNDDGNSWHTLGNLESGANWYNSQGIFNNPGTYNGINQGAIGWSKDSTGWVTSRHPVEDARDVNGVGCVRFRFAYSSNEYHSDEYQGFAIDNFLISKRKRIVLLEEFINSEHAEAYTTDIDGLNDFMNNHSAEVCDIRYHMVNGHDTDPLNYINPNDISGRASEYGALTSGPTTVIDGIIQGPELNLSTEYNKRALKDPAYEIYNVATSLDGNAMRISATIRKVSNHADEFYGQHIKVVRVAVVQKEFYDEQNILHENVLVELLPNGTGNVVARIPADFELNNEINIEDVWIPNVKTIGNDFKIVVYVQSIWGINEVQQVWFGNIPTSSIPQVSSSTENFGFSEEFRIYPNPANDQLHIVSPNGKPQNINWTIYSVSGQVIKHGIILPGEEHSVIPVEDIASGLYVVELINENGERYNQQLSIISR